MGINLQCRIHPVERVPDIPRTSLQPALVIRAWLQPVHGPQRCRLRLTTAPHTRRRPAADAMKATQPCPSGQPSRKQSRRGLPPIALRASECLRQFLRPIRPVAAGAQAIGEKAIEARRLRAAGRAGWEMRRSTTKPPPCAPACGLGPAITTPLPRCRKRASARAARAGKPDPEPGRRTRPCPFCSFPHRHPSRPTWTACRTWNWTRLTTAATWPLPAKAAG